MTSHDIFNITPGQDANVSFKVDNLASGQTIASAVLTVEASENAGVALFTRTITTALNSNGQITNVGNVFTLLFILTAQQTVLLPNTQPYYVYSVQITTSTGAILFPVPIGIISPDIKAS